MPDSVSECSSSASMSAEVTSMLVTGSAVTMIRCTGVGGSAIASSNARGNAPAFSEEKRCVPTKQHQAGDAPRTRVALDVVIAPNTIDPAEHCVVWPPAVPQELDDRDDNRDSNSWNYAKYGNTDEAHND